MLAEPIRELAGRTLGIVGWGELGAAVARVADGVRHARADREPARRRTARGARGPTQLLADADVVSLHCPLTPATRGLIGAAELATMKPDALLINCARGALIDGHALAAALRAGRLGGAGIDVCRWNRRWAATRCSIPGFRTCWSRRTWPGAARESRQRCIDMMAANVHDFQNGGRLGRVV